MRYVRSFPAEIPPNRAYVVDDVERLVMDNTNPETNFSYDCLADVGDDVLLIEWDLAVGKEELETFAERAATAPDRVLFAPYRLYSGGSLAEGLKAVWAAWRYKDNDQRRGWLNPVSEGTPTAHVVGMGLIYLPRDLILGYLDTRNRTRRMTGDDWRFSDISFCGWHFRHVRQEIDLDWQARPVHLHYQLPTIGGTNVD